MVLTSIRDCTDRTVRRGWRPFGRVGLILLLVGWSAFWLNTSLQHCCKLDIPQHAGSAATDNIVTSAAGISVDADLHPAESDDICTGINSAVTAITAAMLPLADQTATQSSALGFATASLAFSAASPDVVPRPQPPPRILPFHQRTSRLLI